MIRLKNTLIIEQKTAYSHSKELTQKMHQSRPQKAPQRQRLDQNGLQALPVKIYVR